MSVLPKIQTAGLTSDDVTELTNKTRELMLDNYFKMTPNIERPVKKDDDKAAAKDAVASPVETLSTKDGSNKSAGQEQDGEKQSSDSKTVGESENTDQHSQEEQLTDRSQTEKDESLVVEGQSSNGDQQHEYSSVVEGSPSDLGVLGESGETKPTKERDESPSSNASHDSFVFVDSSKIEEEKSAADTAAVSDEADVDEREGLTKGEESAIE